MPRVIKRAPQVDPLKLIEEYRKQDELAKAAAANANKLKEMLRSILVEQGASDDVGHLWLEVGDFKLKHEKRVQTGLDRAAALEWCDEHGLRDEVIETVEQFSEDDFHRLVWEKKIPRKVANSFATENVTWAFKLSGGK